MWKLIIMLVLCSTSVAAFNTSSSIYKTNAYFGSGSDNGNNSLYNASYGESQVAIGQVSEFGSLYAIGYGIFYGKAGFTISAQVLSFAIRIADFGIEWIKLNWTV